MKNSIGNVEAKELVSMTVDMNYRGGIWEGEGGQNGVKGGKWHNCNSIISKYIF